MSSTKTLLVALGATASVLLSGQPLATAEPAAPLPMPINGLQAPGLPAMQSARTGHPAGGGRPDQRRVDVDGRGGGVRGKLARRPPSSRNVAAAVNQFVADPQVAHVPAAGAVPGTEAHLPAGRDPAHAVGPAPEAAPEAAAPHPLPEAAPAPAPEAAPAPAPDARTGTRARSSPPVPDAAPAPAPQRPRRRRTPAPAPAPGPTPDFGPDAPVTQDFMYPSISNGCLEGRRKRVWRRRFQWPARRRSPPRGPAQARRPTCSPRSAPRVPPPCRSCR